MRSFDMVGFVEVTALPSTMEVQWSSKKWTNSNVPFRH